MTQQEQIIQCPSHPICSGLHIETGPWCRYRKSDLPPPGAGTFDPRDTWCPPGLQAAVLILGYLAAQRNGPAEPLDSAMEKIRSWADRLTTRQGD